MDIAILENKNSWDLTGKIGLDGNSTKDDLKVCATSHR